MRQVNAVKDSTIQIRIPRNLRDQFNIECRKQGIVPAEWIRNKVIEFAQKEEVICDKK